MPAECALKGPGLPAPVRHVGLAQEALLGAGDAPSAWAKTDVCRPRDSAGPRAIGGRAGFIQHILSAKEGGSVDMCQSGWATGSEET